MKKKRQRRFRSEKATKNTTKVEIVTLAMKRIC